MALGCGYEHKATVGTQRLLSHGEITLSSGAAGVSELTVKGLTHTQATLTHHSPQVNANPTVIRLRLTKKKIEWILRVLTEVREVRFSR